MRIADKCPIVTIQIDVLRQQLKTSFDLNPRAPNNFITLKSASNLNGNLNCSKELEHYAS